MSIPCVNPPARHANPLASNPPVLRGRPVGHTVPLYAGRFDAPNSQIHTHGGNNSDGGDLGNNALLTSMAYRIDRLGNPDVSPKPGALDGIMWGDGVASL